MGLRFIAIAVLVSACAGAVPTGGGADSLGAGTFSKAAPREPWSSFQRVALMRFGLSVELPDRAGWHGLRKKKSRFSQLDHPATGSMLVVSSWLASERMTPATCETEARLYRDFPRAGEVLSHGPRELAGFDVNVQVGVLSPVPPSATKGPAPLPHVEGYITAFGAHVRTCLAFAFTTAASGPDARATIEDLLALMDQRTVTTLRTLDALNPKSRESREPNDTAPR